MEWTNLIVPVLLTLLTGLVFPLILQYTKKIKDDRTRNVVEHAVHVVEQKAKKHDLTSEHKKQEAVTETMKLAQKVGLKVEREVVSTLIESVLGAVTLKNGKVK